MEKLTTEIKVINVYDEEIIIKPISYNIALQLIEGVEKNALLMDTIEKKFTELYDKGEDIQSNKELKNMLFLHDEEHKKLVALREEYNYWYVGLDNLDPTDKERLIKKYLRRATT